MAVISQPSYRVVRMKLSKVSNNGDIIDDSIKNTTHITIKHSDKTLTYEITNKIERDTFWELDVNVGYDTKGADTNGALTILAPYTEDLYENSYYNVLDNNVLNNRIFLDYQVVDYNNTSNDIINLDAIILNIAKKAELQSFHKNSIGMVSGRYKGKQIFSTGINEYNAGIDKSINNQPTVSYLSTTLNEVKWGGGSSPEILGAGAAIVTNILNVGDTTDNVNVIGADNDQFEGTLKQSIPVGSNVNIYQYVNSQNIGNNLEVIANDLSIPLQSEYYLATNSMDDYKSDISTNPNDGTELIFDDNVAIKGVDLDSAGNYTTGSDYKASDIYKTLQESYNKGYKAYISFYTSLGETVEYSGSNKIKNHVFNSGSYSDGTLVDPLGYYGVREIETFVWNPGKLHLYLNLPIRNDLEPGNEVKYDNNDAPGMLIWISKGPGMVVVRDSNLSNLSESVIYTKHSTDIIKNNIKKITSKFGSNN